MKKYNEYNENDEVNVWLGECSVEEVVEDLWELSGDDNEWNVEDDLKDYKDWDFKNGKKYVVMGIIGSRGYYEGVEIVREGDVLLEKDLGYGSDFWIFRKERLEDLERDYKDGCISKEKYEKEVKFWKEGSNRDIEEGWLCGCINESNGDNGEWNEESMYYYYIVNRLRKEDKV